MFLINDTARRVVGFVLIARVLSSDCVTSHLSKPLNTSETVVNICTYKYKQIYT